MYDKLKWVLKDDSKTEINESKKLGPMSEKSLSSREQNGSVDEKGRNKKGRTF